MLTTTQYLAAGVWVACHMTCPFCLVCRCRCVPGKMDRSCDKLPTRQRPGFASCLPCRHTWLHQQCKWCVFLKSRWCSWSLPPTCSAGACSTRSTTRSGMFADLMSRSPANIPANIPDLVLQAPALQVAGRLHRLHSELEQQGDQPLTQHTEWGRHGWSTLLH